MYGQPKLAFGASGGGGRRAPLLVLLMQIQRELERTEDPVQHIAGPVQHISGPAQHMLGHITRYPRRRTGGGGPQTHRDGPPDWSPEEFDTAT